MRLYRRQSGETIMEVLICVAIVGFMMTAAFSLANRNQAYTRAGQERSSAVTIAQSQLELLRNYADLNKLPTATDKIFCFDNSGNMITKNVTLSDAANMLNAATDTDTSKYGSCTQPSTAGEYRYAIWAPGMATTKTNGASNKYLVTVHWISATGNGNDSLELYYEVYDGNSPNYGVSAGNPACSDGIDNDGDGAIDAGGYNGAPADIGCQGDPSKTSEANPQCNNKMELSAPNSGDDDNDGAKDYAPGAGGDPDCTSLTDNREAADPPEEQPFSWSHDGIDYNRCDKIENFGDASDGCLSVKQGSATSNCALISSDFCYQVAHSVLARRTVQIYYNGLGLKPGDATLRITYRQWYGSTAPAGYPGFQLKVNGGDTITLPVGASGEQKRFTKVVNFSSAPGSLNFEWLNNDGSDPDLQIDKVEVYR